MGGESGDETGDETPVGVEERGAKGKAGKASGWTLEVTSEGIVAIPNDLALAPDTPPQSLVEVQVDPFWKVNCHADLST